MPVVLTIAGSDPSGGAGIQSDLRTLQSLGAAGLSAVSALTVQTSTGVRSIHPTPPDVLVAQIESILSDTRPDAIKIGMLCGAAQVRAVADVLRRFPALPPVVYDPVLASTGGVVFLDEEGQQALLSDLLPLCRLLTPNQDEWRRLGQPRVIPVLLKGGHLDGPPNDFLLLPDGERVTFPGERIETTHTHGTGCFLSSAIAALLAHGFAMVLAIREAKRLLTEALQMPVVLGSGRGYPALQTFGSHAARLAKLKGVYVVTERRADTGRGHMDMARAALAGGARVVQLREKRMPTNALIALAATLVRLCHEAGAILIVNDRVDVALAADADGVHVGPGDMSVRDARRILGPGRLVGASTGTVAEALEAAPYASYLGVGALFGTQTKADAGEAVGVSRLVEIGAVCPGLPLVGIGGVSLSNIGEVARAGATSAAVVSAVSGAPDMEAAVRELVRIFTEVARSG